MSIPSRVPNLPIPLVAPDPDVSFNLGEVFAYTYRKGRYARALRYDAPLPAALDESSHQWARERISDWRSAARN